MVIQIDAPESRGLGQAFPVIAPHNGLNTRESFSELQPTEARVLRNWLPDEASCRVRPGHTAHQTITGASTVPVLMAYKGATGGQLVAASNGGIYDVSGTPSALVAASTYSSDRWSHANFNGYLFGVNATDTPWRYNGTTVVATGFTGPTLAQLQTVTQVRNRLWFTLANSADVYYGGIGSVTGALTTFQLSQIAAGGKCIAINSWSRDGGDGSDDVTVFAMDTGEIIVYQGDPATSFTLIGKYEAPRLVAKDATVKMGGELVLMTVSGPIPVSKVLSSRDVDTPYSPEALGAWGKIAPSWRADFSTYGSNLGFNAYFYDGILYFVFPTGTANTLIYVYNTRKPAWTTYTGMPVASLAAYSGSLYFGSYSSNKVFRHATGSDNGSSISTLARTGANYPAGGSRSVRITDLRPNIDADGPAQVQFGLDVDFQDGSLGEVKSIATESAGGDWGGDWGQDWGSAVTSPRKWYGVRGYGRAIAVALATASTALNVKWWATDLRQGPGGQL